ncbi:MAG: response regulator [Chromatiales bacterium]|nr:response regulator [Gammaproteobacteria bacterium]MCP5352737.1 response regulator [Chromatiales bacterium]
MPEFNIRSLLKFAAIALLWLALSWLASGWWMAHKVDTLARHLQNDLDAKARYQTQQISDYLLRTRHVPASLGGEPTVLAALRSSAMIEESMTLPREERQRRWSENPEHREINEYLAKLTRYTTTSVIYVLDATGKCVLASNAGKATSFVGSDYRTRKYYSEAVAHGAGYQYAMGRITNMPGLYFSSAIHDGEVVLGVAVVKVNLDDLSPWIREAESLLVDEYGVIVQAFDPRWELRVLPENVVEQLSPDRRIERYKVKDFARLTISPWREGRHPLLHRMTDHSSPMLISSVALAHGLRLIASYDAGYLLQSHLAERVSTFAAFSVSGLLVLWLLAWRGSVARTRQRNQRDLMDSEERLRRAQAVAHVGSFDWDPVSGRLSWSDEHFRLWGHEPGTLEPTYEMFRQGVHPGDVARVEAALADAVEGGRYYDLVHRVIRPGGEIGYIHGIGEVIFDDSGRAVRMIGTVQDITSQRAHEEAANEARHRFQRLVEGIGERFVIFSHGTDGQLTFVSKGVESVFGVSQAELLGANWGDAVAWSPGTLERVAEGHRKLLGGELRYLELEMAFTHPDGGERTIRINEHLVRDDAGGARSFDGLVEDITVASAIKRELESAKEAALQSAAAKSAFLANMSHEIRTPMNAIIGMLHLVQETELTGRQRDYLGKARYSAENLLGVLNDILDFSKIEAGKLDLEDIPFALTDVVGNLVNLIRMKAEDKGVDIAVRIGNEVPRALVGDPARLGQVLINLGGNAVKFSASGGTVTLTVALQEENEGDVLLHFSVRDTGIGISKAQLAQLFEAFTQADSSTSRKYGGTGLGLVISKRIVDMLGGEIWVESELGAGSTFHFTARFGKHAADDLKAAPIEGGEPDVAAAIRGLHGAKVLVVEDNPINLELVTELLAMHGIETRTAGNGQEALNVLAAESFDGVLMDCQMPLLDGYQATRAIRQRPDLADLPVIALTANAMKGDREKAVAAGMNDHIAKPIDPDRLFVTMAKWIRPA